MVLHFRVGQPSALEASGPGGGIAPGLSASRGVAQLREFLDGRLNESQNRSLTSLEHESDPELFGEGLLQLARRLENADSLESASLLYRWLDSENAPALPGIQSRAQRRLAAIEGRGEGGARAEFLLRRFAREATDPTALFAMGGAGALFRVTRMAMLGRLAMTPSAGIVTRGFGARALASLVGFSVEATAFPFLGRLGGEVLGHARPWSLPDLGHEVAASFITLGALKLCGWGSGSLYRRSLGLTRNLPPTLAQQSFQQAGMLGGIMLGHGVEESLGLRPHQEGATTMVDSLALLLQFNVAGSMTRRLFGRNFHEWERRLDLQSESLGRNTPRLRPNLFGGPALAMVGISPSPARRVEREADPRRAHILMMEGEAPPESLPPLPIFGFEPGEGARAPKPEVSFEYPTDLEAGLSRLEAQMRSPDYLRGTLETLRRNRPDEDLIDRLWFHQLRDLVNRVNFAEYRELDDSILLRRMEGYESDPRSELVYQARRRLGVRGKSGSPALRVLEIRLNREKLLSEGSLDASTPAGSLTQLGALAEMQKILGEGLHLLDPPTGEGDRILRVPSLSYAEALLQEAAGRESLQFHYVDGAIARDEIMNLRSRRIVPVGLTREMVWFGDTQTWTFPFPFSMHDAIFHGSMDSRAVRGGYEISGRIYDWLRRHDSGGDHSEHFMDRLADGELGYGSGLLRGTLGTNLRIYFEDSLPQLSADRSPEGISRLRELSELLGSLQRKWEDDLSVHATPESLAEAEHWSSLQSRLRAALPVEEVRIEVSEPSLPPGLRIHYPARIEDAWRHVEESFVDPNYYSGDRRQLARSRPDPDAVDAIWLHQARHYIHVLPKVRYEVVDAENLLDMNPSKDFPLADTLLRQAFDSLGERGRFGSRAREVLVMRPEDRSETEAQFAWEQHVKIPPTLGETSRFLRHQLQLVDLTDFSSPSYIPSLSLLEALYRGARGSQVQFHEVPGEIPRDLVMALRRRGVSPIGLARGLTHLAHFNERVHPFSFTSHDAFYHAGVLAQMPARYARTAGWLYESAQAHLPEGRIRESFLNYLADLNVPSAEGLGLKMFRQMLDDTLGNLGYSMQRAESSSEYREQSQEIEKNIQAFRLWIENEFPTRRDLRRSQGGFLQAVDVAENRFQTARRVRDQTDALQIPADPIRYTNAELDLVREVESYYEDPQYYEGSREELRRRRVPLYLADRLWFQQAADFAHRIPGAKLKMLDAVSLLEPLDPATADSFDRKMVQSAIERLPTDGALEARQVLELSIPQEYVGLLDQKPELRFLALTPFLHDLEAGLQNRAQLWAADGAGRVVFRIPSLSLTENLIQAVHGEDRAQFHFVPGVIPRDVFSSLHARRVSAVGLTGAPLYFREFEEINGDGAIHPFSFSQHDVFEHAARDASLPRGIPEASHWIYTQLRERVPESSLREETMDRLSDLVPESRDAADPYGTLAHRLFEPLTSRYHRIQRLPRGSEQDQMGEEIRIFGGAVSELMRTTLAANPDLAPHLSVFEAEFEPLRSTIENWNSGEARGTSFLSSIEYPADIQHTWDQISQHFGRKGYMNSNLESLRANRMPPDWVDRLWSFQAQDFARSMPGTRVRMGDVNLFLQASKTRNLEPDVDLIESAIAALGERGRAGSPARQVVQISMSAKQFEEGMMGEGEHGFKSLVILATLFNAEDQLRHDVLFLEPSERRYHFRIPSLSFMEKILQAKYGEETANFHYVPGEISRDQAMGLRARGFSPVGLARNRIYLGDIPELTHPFNFTTHDVFFHAMRDAALPANLQALSERFYRYLTRTKSEDSRRDRTLNLLSDLDWPLRQEGIMDSLSLDLIRELELSFQQASSLRGEERSQEIREIHSLASGLRAHVRSTLVARVGLEESSAQWFSRLEMMLNEMGNEILAAEGSTR